MSKILAIDPGTKLGWAISGAQSGTEDLSVNRHESQGMRFIKLEVFLDMILKDGPKMLDNAKIDPAHSSTKGITLVVYEIVARHKGTHAAHIYGGIVSIIQKMCVEQGIDYAGVPVGTIKKHATGKGNAGKPQMIAAAKVLFPDANIIGEDDNHADALCLLDYAQRNLVVNDE